jgi:hypothetical protein
MTLSLSVSVIHLERDREGRKARGREGEEDSTYLICVLISQ